MSDPVIIEAEIAPVVKTPAPSAISEPVPPSPRKWWQIWKRREKKPKRHILRRLFGIGIWGGLKLVLLCILVGFVLLAMEFDPASPSFDASNAFGVFLSNALAAARWAVTNFWKPALAGAGIVLPIWILWRLLSLPFRR